MFQAGVLLLQVRRLTDLVYFQASVLRLPPVKRLLTDPGPPDQLRHRHPNLSPLHNKAVVLTLAHDQGQQV
jgi:hypothetical protein